MPDDLVSVIIPVRNAGSYIRATLTRILAEAQPLEIIVVDDGSSDDSMDQVRLFRDQRVRTVAGPGKGIAASMNAGLAHARGTILMRCDADDLYIPGRIAEQVLWLQRHADYEAVCGAFGTIDAKGALVADLLPRIGLRPEEITDEIRDGQLRTHLCTYAIRASLVRRAGDFRCYFETAEDLDYQFRLAELGRIYYAPKTWYLWRLHARSATHSGAERRIFFERTAREFQQQRASLAGADALQRGAPPTPPAAGPAESGLRSAQDHVQGMLLARAWLEHGGGEKARALSTGFRAIKERPYGLAVWKSVAALAIKPTRKHPTD